MPDLDTLVKQKSAQIAQQISRAAELAGPDEAAFREQVSAILTQFADEANIRLHQRDEYTLITGRADTVYNRLIVEYEHPGSLRDTNSAASNRHAIQQVKDYIEGVSAEERHKLHRLAGVATDGRYLIFVRHVDESWHVGQPVEVNTRSVEQFLLLLVKTSTGVALIPQNLIEDFKGLQAQKMALALYDALGDPAHRDDLVGKLFRQWQTFFGEVTGYEEGTARLRDKKELRKFARDMGLRPDQADPPASSSPSTPTSPC